MPAPLTVIIPTFNSASTLGPTLACIFEGVEAGLVHQVIFADGGSTDDLQSIAAQTGAALVSCAPGRGTQMAAAAATAQTEWLLFLHGDTQLSADWSSAVHNHIGSKTTAAYFHLLFDATGFASRFTAAWANLRSHLFGLPYGDQGLLISTDLYTEIGGYPNIPLMEDVAIAQHLRGKLTPLPASATTQADKYLKNGWLLQGSTNLITLTRYLLGTDPNTLAKRYTR